MFQNLKSNRCTRINKIFYFIRLYFDYLFSSSILLFLCFFFLVVNDKTDVCEKHAIHLYLHVEDQGKSLKHCAQDKRRKETVLWALISHILLLSLLDNSFYFVHLLNKEELVA